MTRAISILQQTISAGSSRRHQPQSDVDYQGNTRIDPVPSVPRSAGLLAFLTNPRRWYEQQELQAQCEIDLHRKAIGAERERREYLIDRDTQMAKHESDLERIEEDDAIERRVAKGMMTATAMTAIDHIDTGSRITNYLDGEITALNQTVKDEGLRKHQVQLIRNLHKRTLMDFELNVTGQQTDPRLFPREDA